MFTEAPQPPHGLPRLLGLLAAIVFLLILLAWLPQPDRAFISHWQGPVAALPGALLAAAQPEAAPIVIQATPDPSALEHYNQGSALQDADPSGRVRFYRRDVAGGSIAYFVVTLDQQV